MKWRNMFVLMIVALIVSGGLIAGCGGPAPEPTEAPQVEEEGGSATVEGEVLLQERCTDCHNLDRVVGAQKDRDGWEQNVTRMVGKGAELTAEEQAVLVDYLTETYGP